MHKLQIDQIQEGINWIAADTNETNTAESYRLEKETYTSQTETIH